jgi:Carbohydrate binding module (family 6)
MSRDSFACESARQRIAPDSPQQRLHSGAAGHQPRRFSWARSRFAGTIEVERFNEGVANVAYFDLTPANSGGVFRTTDVDIQATTDTGGGYNVGWVDPGEWLNYTVSIAAPGSYTLDVRVAAITAGGTFRVNVNGVNVTGPLSVPNTGGWQSWTTVTKTGISLAAGPHVLRLVFDSAGPGGIVGNFNWLRVR